LAFIERKEKKNKEFGGVHANVLFFFAPGDDLNYIKVPMLNSCIALHLPSSAAS